MRRFPTAREDFPPSDFGATAVAITLLTYYIVSMHYEVCQHRWTVANDEVSAWSPG
jgi:hypothetical protein